MKRGGFEAPSHTGEPENFAVTFVVVRNLPFNDGIVFRRSI
jgi:hypothetical protein